MKQILKTMWRGFKTMSFVVFGVLILFLLSFAFVVSINWVIFYGPLWAGWTTIIVGGSVFLGLASYIVGDCI